jgi:single-stranded-DNA-specific exonuclease
MPAAVSAGLIDEIETAGPFGQGAPAPRFAFAAMALSGVRRIGENHLRFSFGDAGSARLDAVAFGAFDGPLAELAAAAGAARFHLAGRLELNSWGGKSRVQLRLEDAARA